MFGCKCFILNKKPKISKFASKVDEGFLLGYGSNEHAYRVFNKTFGRVKIAVDMTFDESNGSQVEQVDSSVVGKEDPSCEAIKQLAIGDIRPQEKEVTEVEVPQVATHLFLLTYLMLNSSRHLPQHLHAAVPHMRAVVPHLHSQQQLIRL